jgi:hypothetical protein
VACMRWILAPRSMACEVWACPSRGAYILPSARRSK